MNVTTAGLDLAKNVFQLHGVDARGKCVVNKKLRRDRGLLAEFGLIIPKGIAHVARRVPQIIEDGVNELPGSFRLLMQRLVQHLKELDRQVDELEQHIRAGHRANDLSLKLEKIPGVGPITASALVATVGDAKAFENARQMAAWLGLVPSLSWPPPVARPR